MFPFIRSPGAAHGDLTPAPPWGAPCSLALGGALRLFSEQMGTERGMEIACFVPGERVPAALFSEDIACQAFCAGDNFHVWGFCRLRFVWKEFPQQKEVGRSGNTTHSLCHVLKSEVHK